MEVTKEQRYVTYNGKNIEYSLIRKQVKNINLRIKREGKVVVSANYQVPVSYIDNFVVSKGSFILNALTIYEKKRENLDMKKRYVDGEYFQLLGKKYCLKVVKGEMEEVLLKENLILLRVKNIEDFKQKEKLMNDWFENKQKTIFHQICREVYPMFESYQIEYPIIKMRYMTARWGSCQPVRGIITLNRRLIAYKRKSIEYVVLHEFAHFVHPNHSKKFYQLVEQLMPDWKQRKKEFENYY